jgi:hypothetical protein
MFKPLNLLSKVALACIAVGMTTLSSAQTATERPLAKFEPPANKVLLFVGQDNETVGGNPPYNDGYVDKVGVPAGITHYVYMTEGWKNGFNKTFDVGHIDGLLTETEWAAGPMCMVCYLKSPKLKDTLIHLSISMEGNSEDSVADGTYDHLIKELSTFLNDYKDRKFLIRIGYEFDGSWNNYDAPNFKKAFIRIVDKLRADKRTNFATVMGASSAYTSDAVWDKYYPGDDYVDWMGYSYFGGNVSKKAPTLEYARAHKKPIFIAEASPRGKFLSKAVNADLADDIWYAWFDPFFQQIEANTDVIKAISYINTNWDAQTMWKGGGWGDARLQSNPFILKLWKEEMAKPLYISSPIVIK